MTPLKFIESLLDKCLNIKHFQDYVNGRFDVDFFLKIDGFYYALNHSIMSVESVKDEYSFEGIGGATILDVGGNVGAFAIPASKHAKHIYSVEPLFTEQLQKNVNKNNIKNITVIESGLGSGTRTVKYNEKSKKVRCLSFSEIKALCSDNINFLKIDCEGCEWDIIKEDLNGINRIEMELHCFNGEKIDEFLPRLDDYNCEIIYRSPTTYMLHCILKK